MELAALRSKRVELADEVFICQEPPLTASQDFSALLKTDRHKAYVFLIENFVRNEAGGPAFTHEEAEAVAGGSKQVFMPLFLAVTGFVNDAEKKASPPTNSSDTALPTPSEDQSKN